MSGNSIRKKKAYKMKVVIQNLPIKDYHDIHVIPYKDLEMLILPTPIPLLARIVL